MSNAEGKLLFVSFWGEWKLLIKRQTCSNAIKNLNTTHHFSCIKIRLNGEGQREEPRREKSKEGDEDEGRTSRNME